jgi:hypothetical protein
MRLQDRYWEITVGTKRIASASTGKGRRPLAVSFEVAKSLGREPNRASVKVANLSKPTRESLEQADEPELQIRAGYQEQGLQDTIFVGDTQDIYSTREGADIWTMIESEDGGRSSTVLTTIAGAMGVGIGNTASVAASATLSSGSNIFARGLAIEGPAWRSLDTVCRSANLRWSVQSGVLQLRQQRRPAEVTATLLSPSTGLIGSPARTSRDPRTGDISVTATSLIVPGLFPGTVVVLESTTVQGSWMVHTVRYTGSTIANDWYAELTLKEYDV